MSERIFEEACSFFVSDLYMEFEAYVPDERECVVLAILNDHKNFFSITPAEATALKEFLIRKGF
jgi:hypothetical protein